MKVRNGGYGYIARDTNGALCLPAMPSAVGARRCAVWYRPTRKYHWHQFEKFGHSVALNQDERDAWKAAYRDGWRVVRVRVTEVKP